MWKYENWLDLIEISFGVAIWLKHFIRSDKYWSKALRHSEAIQSMTTSQPGKTDSYNTVAIQSNTILMGNFLPV